MKNKPVSIEFRDITIPKTTIDIILKKTKHPMKVLGLYAFYYYTAIWQKTNKVWCTTSFTAQAMKCSEGFIRKIKKELSDLNLIKDTQENEKKTGQFSKRFIQVFFYQNNHRTNVLPYYGETGVNAYSTGKQTVGNFETKVCQRNKSLNLRTKNTTPKDTPQHRLSLQLYKILKKIVPAKNNGMPQLNNNGKRIWNAWHRSFRELLDQGFRSEEQISAVIEFYGKHNKQQFMPKLYSAQTFCKEIHRVENLMGESPVKKRKMVNGHDLYKHHNTAKSTGKIVRWTDEKKNKWEMLPDGTYTCSKPSGEYYGTKLDDI